VVEEVRTAKLLAAQLAAMEAVQEEEASAPLSLLLR